MLGGGRAELPRLVPELAATPAAAVTSPPGRLFELLLGTLHRLAEKRAVLLLVEDLHWADRSTRDMLGFLIRNLSGGNAVLTYRSDCSTAATRCARSSSSWSAAAGPSGWTSSGWTTRSWPS